VGHAGLALDGVGLEQEDLRNHRGLAQSADRGRASLRVPGRHRAHLAAGGGAGGRYPTEPIVWMATAAGSPIATGGKLCSSADSGRARAGGWADRGGVRERISAADHRSGRSGHADHDDRDARGPRAGAMISLPAGARVWLATGHTDMRKGFDGLALLVQETLKRNPHTGHLFVFRGRRGSRAT
jgi:IS66 Orf2 like protein